MIFIAALAAIALSLALAGRAPVQASDPATLQESQVGTDSSEAEDACQEGDEVPAGMVLWHFILNGLNPGITSAISGEFEFEDDGTLNVDSSKWNPGGDTHHFYVYTSGDDVLEGASADIGDSEYNNFVLSHICHGDETEESVEQSVEESVAESVAESAEESGEQSVEAGTGTPEESVSDGAFFGDGSSPLPTIAFSLILLASLGGLAYANVKTVRSRI